MAVNPEKTNVKLVAFDESIIEMSSDDSLLVASSTKKASPSE